VQMLQGKLPSGDQIGVYNSISYAVMKEKKNPLAKGAVDLKLTGAFHGAMTTKGNGTEWETDSSDSKRNMLVEKYDDPFG
ncbi:hypothetical protein, partial [Escherichia coli]|uniref:hypothetical protein n=1 Tax=Escherichia coli TaxID=562 RepID=UPI003D062F71